MRVWSLLPLCVVPLMAIPIPAEDATLVIVGLYDSGGVAHDAVHIFSLEEQGLVPRDVFDATPNTSWVTVHPSKNFVFCVHEMNEWQGQPGGAVSAYTIERNESPRLNHVNTVSSGGAGPVHAVVSQNGEHLIVANYVSGSVSVFNISQETGALSLVETNVDSGPAGSQAHAHSSACLNNRYVFVPDLGLNRVYQWLLQANGTLLPNTVPWLQLPDDFGPRHLAFNAPLKHAYLADEGTPTSRARVTVLSYIDDSSSEHAGQLTVDQTVSTLPAGADPTDMFPAEVLLSPNGKFVYVSNRDGSTKRRDSIAVFPVNQTGMLEAAMHVPVGSILSYPRSMTLSVDGAWMIVGGQKTNNVAVFCVEDNGMLSFFKETTLPQSVAFVGML